MGVSRTTWTPRRVLAVAVGGVVGAGCRWGLLAVVGTGGSFPWPVLALNLVGSLFLGMALAEEWSHHRSRVVLHDVIGIGFCGGLTTFSTFAVEVAELLDDARPVTAGFYVAASVLGTVISVTIGAALLRGVRGLTLPLEEMP